MLGLLNNLNMEFQMREVDMTSVQSLLRRTVINIRGRYIECGDDFGGGQYQLLSVFLAKLKKSHNVIVEGMDGEGRPQQHSYELHEEAVYGSKTPSDLQSCLEVCRAHAKATIKHLQKRLKDLDNLNGVRLIMPDTYPPGREARDEECRDNFEILVDLFHARNRAEILPGK
ncbi:unnamed protein product [Closterium sp. Naga37s-1]|nr:unnamed protein product [Closterium sp. Naga37s-1]